MSIEIDVLNGDASWQRAEPCIKAVFGPHIVEKLPWGHIEWAHADLRVLIERRRAGSPAMSASISAPSPGTDSKIHVGGIGGVMTREDCRRRGYASLALNAALDTIRANEAARFAVLFCEEHNFAFYGRAAGIPSHGEVYCEQPERARPLRSDGALRVRHPPRAARRRARSQRPAVVMVMPPSPSTRSPPTHSRRGRRR